MTNGDLDTSTIEAGDGSGYGGYSTYDEVEDTAYPERNSFFTPDSDNQQREELGKARKARNFGGLWHTNGGRKNIRDKIFTKERG